MIDLDAICECGHAFGKHTPMGAQPGECMECWWAHRGEPGYVPCKLHVSEERIVAGTRGELSR